MVAKSESRRGAVGLIRVCRRNWSGRVCLLKDYVAVDAVEGIGKINLEEDLRLPGGRRGSRTAITSGGMDRSGFTTTAHGKTKLRRCHDNV